MGTRCLIRFEGEDRATIYQHWDGDHETVVANVKATIASGKAWPLPRFEGAEFAAAYIATCKDGPGNFRVLAACDDASYVHTVRPYGSMLRVETRTPGGGRRLVGCTDVA